MLSMVGEQHVPIPRDVMEGREMELTGDAASPCPCCQDLSVISCSRNSQERQKKSA